MFDGARAAPAWIRGARYALAYRRLEDGRDPHEVPGLAERLRALRARFEAADRDGGWESLTAALMRCLPFVGIEDWMFRQVSQARSGTAAMLRLGFRCNQDCSFCWQGRDWPEPPAEHYLRWVDEMAALDVRNLSISGGEPTIHPALHDVIARARDHRMNVTLQTNAIRLGKAETLRRLVDAGLSQVFVSLHSADADTSDRMTRAPRTFGPTVRGIEACAAAGVKVRLNCVVERANYTRLGDHARFVVERFVRPYPENPAQEVTYTFPTTYFDQGLWREALVPLDEVRPHLLEAVSELSRAGVAVQALGTCGFPPCVLRGAPEAIWWLDSEGLDEMDLSARAFGEACQRCAERPRCLGVRREYLEVFGDRGLVPFEAELPR